MTKANILQRPSSKLEYIWLDGYTPTANLRSKTKIEADFGGKLKRGLILDKHSKHSKITKKNDASRRINRGNFET